MKRYLIFFFLIIPLSSIQSQNKTEENIPDSKKYPVQTVRTDLFKLKNLNFNKKQPDNSGEILEIEFQIENLVNASHDLYIFTIATYENEFKTKSSFMNPRLDDHNIIKLLIASPEDKANFEYMIKDSNGSEKKMFIKYPKNIKAGIDQKTGKPYRLDDIVTFRSFHLCRYQKKYNFFNNVTILIFDAEEKLLFRQVYTLKPTLR